MCADLVLRLGVKKSYQQKQNNMTICSDFFSHFSDPKAPFISQTGAVSKILFEMFMSPGEN